MPTAGRQIRVVDQPSLDTVEEHSPVSICLPGGSFSTNSPVELAPVVAKLEIEASRHVDVVQYIVQNVQAGFRSRVGKSGPKQVSNANIYRSIFSVTATMRPSSQTLMTYICSRMSIE